MINLIKNCYKEAGLFGNAVIYENRKKAIEKILEEADIGYFNIALGLFGNESEEIQSVLYEVEKQICTFDPNFQSTDEKEMQVLCAILLLEHCKENDELTIPLMILCDEGVEKSIACPSLYDEFELIVDQERVKLRECDEEKVTFKNTGFSAFKKSITEEKNEAEDQEFEYTTSHIDKMISIIEIQDQNINLLKKNNSSLQKKVKCEREESDILWWLINKWSDAYSKLFEKMTSIELAIAIPIELSKYSQFNILPYSADKIIKSILEKNGDSADEITLSEYMKNVNEDILDRFNLKKSVIGKVQPILGAVCCMKDCGLEEISWNGKLKNTYGADACTIRFKPLDFALHFCLELELYKSFNN